MEQNGKKKKKFKITRPVLLLVVDKEYKTVLVILLGSIKCY